MQKYRYILTLCILLLCFISSATHNRAGEITYRHVSGYTYEITIITYTYTPSQANEDRNNLPVDFGDGVIADAPRISQLFLPDNYTKNTYVYTHTYPGAGTYQIVMEDPNRNEGIDNIFDSVNIPFAIKTTLKIDPGDDENSAPILLNPPIDKAAKDKIFIHNPSAYDPDGDSLSYSLSICYGRDGEPIPGYEYPNASDSLYVDPISGDLIWMTPTEIGNFNVAVMIEEWRRNIKIGQIIRDIQIEVLESENNPPVISAPDEICVRAGNTISIEITATDPDGDFATLSAMGGPFTLTPTATFETKTDSAEVSSTFSWIPNCDQVRQQPYMVVFKAQDQNEELNLQTQKEMNIRVIGHPPTPSNISASTNSISIEWDECICNNVIGYELYRSQYPSDYTPEDCEIGMPASPEFVRIANITDLSQNIFEDDNNNDGLSNGFEYCYRMLAVYPDSSISYASNELCIEVKKGLPTITNVSIESTNSENGIVYLAWSPPTDFDTITFAPPYRYEVVRNPNKTADIIFSTNNLNDTIAYDSLTNTLDSTYSYSIRFYSNDSMYVGASPIAYSLHTIVRTQDRKVILDITEQVPWNNYQYIVYRKDEETDQFEILDTTALFPYTDSSVFNDMEYCYFYQSTGEFARGNFVNPILNNSQIACGYPMDTIAPSFIKFSLSQDCEAMENILTWENYKEGNESIQSFEIYYSECESGSYKKIAEIDDQREYQHSFSDSLRTMAGCYYISAIDEAGNASKHLFDTCTFTCPTYKIPNIFTPNKDGENEVLLPKPYRFVDKIDLKIYNRWGVLVFETNNPDINWDGKEMHSQTMLTSGVYYYVCDVYEQWPDCKSHPRTLVGFIHVFTDSNSPQRSSFE